MKRVGIISSGGDAPGTNACIRALARCCFSDGIDPVGIFDSWDGLLSDDVRVITREDVTGIVQTAGTILRSSRSKVFLNTGDEDRVKAALAKHQIDGLLVIGGNGSQKASAKLSAAGFPVIGIPKTIDNDLAGTDLTVGFQTAVEMCTRALDSLRATAESHNRVMIVEVMGRDSGWIAVESAIAGGADQVLIPEFEFTLEDVCKRLRTRHETHGRNYSIIVIAEGAADSVGVLSSRKKGCGGLGVGQILAQEIETQTGYNTRCTTLGYLQRCAVPIAADRILATRLSSKAFELLRSGVSGKLVSLTGSAIDAVELSSLVCRVKKVEREYVDLVRLFG